MVLSPTHRSSTSYFLLSVFFLQLAPNLVIGELFTAHADLENVAWAQQSVIEAIQVYLAQETARLNEIQRRLLPLVERSQKPIENVTANPLNAFLLVKGLTVDLDDLVKATQDNENADAFKSKVDELKSFDKFPSEEDLSGAATALARLQDTYLLDTSAMARGELNNHCCSFKLTADDCFELGRLSYQAGDYGRTIQWMTEALVKQLEEKQNGTSSFPKGMGQADVLEYLAFSSYQKGEVKKALDVTRQLLAIDPNHSRAQGNIGHYERIIEQRKGEDGGVSDRTFTVREKRIADVGLEKTKYEALCRGETKQHQGGFCRYVHNGNPFLFIGPAKQEVVHFKPDIYIYHGIISDDEIQVIKQLALPKLKRATVHNHVTGELETAQYRITKSAWLQGGDHPLVEILNQRIHQITGLELETAEELQVANYGLGGHYEPHYDFARREEKDAFKSLGTGNRIATWLFYMSDVEAGGATVFPSLDLALWPIKGSAAFWYNLLEDGKGDLSTRHAGCPVLLGTKWVSNKWIHERGQEFRRPCKLQPSEPSPFVDG